VKLCGPGKASTRPSSIGSPAASANTARKAWRGNASRPLSARAISSDRGPDRRTMPTPPAPGAVAIAAIVSPAIGSLIAAQSGTAKTRR